MAERPRLKKSDEILGSIVAEPSRALNTPGAGSRPSSERGGGQERRARIPEPKPPSLEDMPENMEQETELSEPQLPSAQDLAKKLLRREDKNPLDFSKYELPKRGGPSAKPAESVQPQTRTPSVLPPEREAQQSPASPPVRTATVQPQAVTTPPVRPATVKPQAAAPPPVRTATAQPPASVQPTPILYEANSGTSPVVMEYTFQSFEDEPEDHVREFQMENAPVPAQEPRRFSRERPRRRAAQAKTESPRSEPEFELESPFEPEPVVEPDPNEIAPRPEPRKADKPAQRSRPEPKPEPEDNGLTPDERNRQDFLKRISSQFERRFEERFEDGLDSRVFAKNPEPKLVPPEPKPVPPPERTPAPEPEAEFVRPDDGALGEIRRVEDDFLTMIQRKEQERQEAQSRKVAEDMQRELREQERRDFEVPARDAHDESAATEFLARFEHDVRDEEERRSEEFKETLAQKFMRERERYLKELGEIEPHEPPEDEVIAAPPARRKLDFQIQPEMHLSEPDQPPARRAAEPVTYTRGAVTRQQIPEPELESAPASHKPASKKTGEQLLMELGRGSRMSAPPPKQKPQNFNFTFETPENQAKKTKTELLPKEKWPRRIIITSMICGLLAIGLLVWPLVNYMRLSDTLSGLTEQAPPSAESEPVAEDTLSVYDSTGFTETAKVNNVVFKKAGTTLRNVDVNDYVIIEDIESKGKIRLEDMSVNSAVSVKSSGIDTLELHNVRAERVIINNTKTDMTVSATGSTDVGIIEIRTPASIRQTDIADGAPGIRGMVITANDSGNSVNAKLDGLSLHTLDAETPETVLVFENGTRAETMSSYGSLSLTGRGKVSNLSISADIGLGAGDSEDKKDVSLIVKGVDITHLNIKSPADINLEAAVDNIYTSDNINVVGNGSIGTFTINPGLDSVRLLADISGGSIQSFYSNAMSRVNVTGSARINTLTASQSTYALGNKVNQLNVNANDVIYENEPDRMIVAPGIRPPQSKAENPGLDYNTVNTDIVSDLTGEDFATTCGHSRESGGFLLGNGSKDDPYDVSSPAQLSHVGTHPGSHFLQSADIDVASDSRFVSDFPMIGSGDSPFTGIYDGMGFAITNLRIATAAESIGLFAVNKGLIQNVRLVSGDISSTSDSSTYIGGIAGLNADGGSIRSCSNGAAVNGGQYSYAGGITGYNFNSRVHDCYNYAKIVGGDIVGGLVGLNSRSAGLTGCYNAGIVEAAGDAGAVAGQNEDATIANCYYLIDTADLGIASGTGTAIDKTAGELREPQMAADLAAGNEESLWVPGETSSGGYHYPVHRKPAE